MREIVLDTETTGLDPVAGHRLVEIGCVEIFNHVATGRVFHSYLNPEREVPIEAFNVHGLSYDFLKDQPLFGHVVEDLLSFLEDAPLIIHNARFDMKFINHELERLSKPPIPYQRTIDTLDIARQQFPGSPASLDALCRRFKIDNSSRIKHGALLDAELLAEIYLELKGGRQPDLEFSQTASTIVSVVGPSQETPIRSARFYTVSEEERQAHQALLARLSHPLWVVE
jgi:DNA polymerase-3 subunit epsilon